ncbi:hypothetical protein VFPPC_11358 [Pochonia chlamydosporia 170]|uniref:Uncharacterized protein n=1 Tax=Pochonia chlamydosporia 170 TaxID=1380566 RepID=A0A179EY15_METCM|nr:hypothetical protein VFPPC_11358 [Pochonia chlamydosporia 170]OAQ57900.1 hypothetical protein VFPPC_11358 [Pochonia chlamydosporia 170]
MPMPLSQKDLAAMADCLDSVREDVVYAERILAESNAKITKICAYIQISLSKTPEDDEQTPNAPSTPTTPRTPWATQE